MPTWTESELRDAIAAGHVGAISVDTNVFEPDYNLQRKIYLAPRQLVESASVTYLLTEIVEGEIRSHIQEQIKKAASELLSAAKKIEKALRKTGVQMLITGSIPELSDHSVQAQRQLDAYRKDSDATTLKTDQPGVLDSTLQQYWKRQAPFEDKADKKHEFPDALALNSIEHWGGVHGRFVLVVSADKGWRAFADSSDWLVCRKDLASALSAFHAHDAYLARKIVDGINNGKHAELGEAIESELRGHVEGLTVYIEAATGYPYEEEVEEVEYLCHDPIDASDFNVVESGDDYLIISAEVYVTARVRVSFVFMVHDEGDEIPFASAHAEAEEQFWMTVTFTVAKDSENPELRDIERSGPERLSVDFNSVEPDFGGDEDYLAEDPIEEWEEPTKPSPDENSF